MSRLVCLRTIKASEQQHTAGYGKLIGVVLLVDNCPSSGVNLKKPSAVTIQ